MKLWNISLEEVLKHKTRIMIPKEPHPDALVKFSPV